MAMRLTTEEVATAHIAASAAKYASSFLLASVSLGSTPSIGGCKKESWTSPWVFPSDAGTPLDAARVAKRFRSLLRVAGLPRFRLYDLRHTYATDLLAAGAPITCVANQLGHRKPTTTLAFYAHWVPRGDKA